METKRQFSSNQIASTTIRRAVTEQSTVDVYGDSAVVVGDFAQGGQSKKYSNRERFCRYLQDQRIVEVCRGSYGAYSEAQNVRFSGLQFPGT
jgi:hypothetical protein